jgi:beta-glucosidase
MAYLPGSEGGRAIADVLFGARNPSGRLPFSWPKASDQLPAALPDTPTRPSPLLEFGTGLSYTRFSAENLRLSPNEARVDLVNTGQRTGTRTLLAWHQDANGSRLAGWARVRLNRGERQTVSIPLTSFGGPTERKIVIEGLSQAY